MSCNASLISKNVTVNKIYAFFNSKFREGSYFSEFPKSVFLTVDRSKTRGKNKNMKLRSAGNKAKDNGNGNGPHKEEDTMQTKIDAEIDRRRIFLNT